MKWTTPAAACGRFPLKGHEGAPYVAPGATPADRQSRIRGVRLAMLVWWRN
jgi:hypothetical protein